MDRQQSASSRELLGYDAMHSPTHAAAAGGPSSQHATTSSSSNAKSIQKHILFAAILGFLLIGVGAVGCVAFGIIEIISNDSIFKNDGLGEVLTVLGIYFTVPYLFCIGTFLFLTFEPTCFKGMNFSETNFMLGLTILTFLVQQSVTDIYLHLLVSPWALFIVSLDLAVLVLYFYFKLRTPHATVVYTVLYAIKMAMQYPDAYETANQTFFGQNGINVMLFLCIPMVQFPLYLMGTSQQGRNGGGPQEVTNDTTRLLGNSSRDDHQQQSHLVESFTSNFNLFLSHLLHSLDIISMYSFAFVPPIDTEEQVNAPSQFKVLIIIVITVAFLANNLGVVHLFYQREDVERAEIPLLPRRLRDASRRVDMSAEDNDIGSHQRRMFQYMLFMLVVCDVPMLLTRFELWRQQYTQLNIFVAKNIKSIADAVMMILRADHTNEERRQANLPMSRASAGGGPAAGRTSVQLLGGSSP